MSDYIPGYVRLYKTGELGERIKILKERLKCCVVCPHHCKVDRLNNERGFCRAGADMVIDGYGPHYGEESKHHVTILPCTQVLYLSGTF